MVQIIGFVGYSDSGKTTVVSTLIEILKRRNYKVAAIKHAAHGYDLDVPGKDSWRHCQAGADTVITVGSDSYTIHERVDSPPSLESVLKKIVGVDFILIEGFKNEPGSKVEIIRRESFEKRIPGNHGLVAVVSDIELEGEIPCFGFAQLEDLADFLIAHEIGKTDD